MNSYRYSNDAAPVTSIILTTQSTSAAWTPTAVTNSGDLLQYEVTGGVTASYLANKPTIDLSGNTGTATITISSTNWALVTAFRLNACEIITADFTIAVGLTNIWLNITPQLTSVIGFKNLINLTGDCRMFSNPNLIHNLDLRDLTSLTNCGNFYSNKLTSVNVTGRSNILNLGVSSNQLTSIIGLADLVNMTALNFGSNQFTSIDLTTNIKLTSLTASVNQLSSINLSTNIKLTAIAIQGNPLLSVLDISALNLLTNLSCGSCGFPTLNTTGNPLLKTINLGGLGSAMTVSGINNVILQQDAKGLSNGNLNWNGLSPSKTENTLNDVLTAYNNLLARGYILTGAVPS